MYLISQNEYYDEDGYYIVERVYSDVVTDIDVRAANGLMATAASGTSGSGTFRNQKSIYNTDGILTGTYWVSGFFTWNSASNNVTVANVQKGQNTELKVISERLDYNSNQGFNLLLGRKYAYARYYLTVANWSGIQTACEIYIDVNVDGV